MPVEDHPVHPHGQRSVPLAGCYNKPRTVPPLQVLDMEIYHGGNGEIIRIQKERFIAHRMTTLCQQDGTLPECAGCKNANQGEGK